jgi:hypothetical protein
VPRIFVVAGLGMISNDEAVAQVPIRRHLIPEWSFSLETKVDIALPRL